MIKECWYVTVGIPTKPRLKRGLFLPQVTWTEVEEQETGHNVACTGDEMRI